MFLRACIVAELMSYKAIASVIFNIDCHILWSHWLRYKPGAWIEKVGGLERSDYDVPKTTCLLMVGPSGSGKSSLINRISKVLEDDKFAPPRAQESCITFSASI